METMKRSYAARRGWLTRKQHALAKHIIAVTQEVKAETTRVVTKVRAEATRVTTEATRVTTKAKAIVEEYELRLRLLDADARGELDSEARLIAEQYDMNLSEVYDLYHSGGDDQAIAS